MISKLFTRCPFCGHEIINDTLYYKYEKVYSPQKSKDERSMEETENESSEETTIPRCRAYVNDKQNILLNIFCFLLNFLAWIPYLILKKKHPKMAEGSVFWGLIGSAVLLLGIMMTTGKVNPFCVIMCIVYYVLWRHE